MKTAATPRVMAYRDGQTTHALLLGAVNRDSAPLYRRRLVPYTEQGCRAVALDLGEAEYIDSDGVRWLTQFHDELSEREISLVLAVRQGSRVERTLKLLRLDTVLVIQHYPTEEGLRSPGRTSATTN